MFLCTVVGNPDNRFLLRGLVERLDTRITAGS